MKKKNFDFDNDFEEDTDEICGAAEAGRIYFGEGAEDMDDDDVAEQFLDECEKNSNE